MSEQELIKNSPRVDSYPIRWVAPAIAFIIGIAITGFVTNNLLVDAKEANAKQLSTIGKEIIFSIDAELERYSVLLSSADAYLQATDKVDRQSFKRYFESIKSNPHTPQNISLSYNPLISFSDLEKHEQSVVAEGFDQYYVSPLGQRESYTPILFIEPLLENQTAMGYDTYSESLRKAAMDRSLLLKQPVITQRINLVQSSPLEPATAVIMYYPHQRTDPNNSMPVRAANLQGWLGIVISLDRLFGNTLLVKNTNLLIDIYDGSDEDNSSLIYSNVPKTNTPNLEHLFTEIVEIGNRQWTFNFSSPAQSLLSKEEQKTIYLDASLFGIFISFFFALYLFQVLTTRSGAYILNHRITKDLAESELRFKTMFEQAPIGIAKVNSTTGNIVEANRMYARLVGVPYEHVNETDWKTITHPDDLQRDMNLVAQLISDEIDGFKVDKRYLHPDGKIVWVSLVAAALHNPEQTQRFHLSMIDDITAVKKEKAALDHAIKLKDIALKSAKAIHFEWEVATNQLIVDASSGLTFDRKLDAHFGENHGFLNLVHPDDKNYVIKTFSQQVSQG